jgi:dienelactone hydrolase
MIEPNQQATEFLDRPTALWTRRTTTMRPAPLLLIGLTALLLTTLSIALLPSLALAQRGPAVAILMPGAGGPIPSDFLVRNRNRFTAAGIETRITTSPEEAADIARAERQKGRKVVIVGMSLGSVHAGLAIGRGAQLNGLVLVSGLLGKMAEFAVANGLSPAKLPPTLIVHHRNDACEHTLASGVGRFQQWARGRARVVWIDTKPRSTALSVGITDPAVLNNPCYVFNSAHGFYMLDGAPMRAIIGFIRSR